MLLILIFGQVCRQSADGYIKFKQVFHALQSLNYLLFDQFLPRKQFSWIAQSEK